MNRSWKGSIHRFINIILVYENGEAKISEDVSGRCSERRYGIGVYYRVCEIRDPSKKSKISEICEKCFKKLKSHNVVESSHRGVF